MKKQDLIKIIKEELKNTLNELDILDDPVATGAHANLQTRLKDGDPEEIEKAIEFQKALGAGQGAAASALLVAMGFPAAALPAENAMVKGAVNVFSKLPTKTKSDLYNLGLNAYKNGTGSEAMRKFLSQASKHLL